MKMGHLKFDTHRGVIAVELAVVFPLLVILAFGIIEVGQALSVRIAMLDAARGACRLATLENSTNQEVVDHVADSMSAIGVSEYIVVVTPAPLSSASKGDLAKVVVSAQFDSFSWFAVPAHFAGMTISGACSLPHE